MEAISIAVSIAFLFPVTIITRSAPLPSVKALTISTGFCVEAFMIVVAPNSQASDKASSLISTAMICFGFISFAACTANNPTPPQPYTTKE